MKIIELSSGLCDRPMRWSSSGRSAGSWKFTSSPNGVRHLSVVGAAEYPFDKSTRSLSRSGRLCASWFRSLKSLLGPDTAGRPGPGGCQGAEASWPMQNPMFICALSPCRTSCLDSFPRGSPYKRDLQIYLGTGFSRLTCVQTSLKAAGPRVRHHIGCQFWSNI